MEILLQLLPPRVLFFLFGLFFLWVSYIAFGWAWGETAKIKRALGPEGVAIKTNVWLKQQKSSSSHGKTGSTFYTTITVDYLYDDHKYREEITSSGTPFENAKEGDVIEFRIHPSAPEYLVHPSTKPPSAILRSIPGAISLLLGLFIVGAITISYINES